MNFIHLVFLFGVFLGINCGSSPGDNSWIPWEPTKCPDNWPEEIRKVTDNVYVAIGYAIANSIMVIAPEGLIIVDVTETLNSSRRILNEFRKISDKPIKAIIYTHYHHDHIMGAQTFIEDPHNPPEIWSDIKLPHTLEQFLTYTAGIRIARATRQFGVFVEEGNGGLGNTLLRGEEGFVLPNKFVFKTTQTATIAGLDVVFMQIPGESSDQIGMWVPEWKILFPGDTVYEAFPNLYSIRGTPMRDPKLWYNSVQNIIDLRPNYIVGSHHYPMIGCDFIRDTLTYYRDAIQLVHDQSVRFTNKGYHPDEVAKMVKLPKKLARQPYLQQCYGTVDWSSRGVFQFYLGWFSGDPNDLFPLSFFEKAKRVMGLVGGYNELISKANDALILGDYRWALELSTYALEINGKNKLARKLKVKSLRCLGDVAPFTLAKNYYRTTALEVEGSITLGPVPEKIHELIYAFRMRQLFELMPIIFETESCRRTDIFAFIFKDTGLKVYFQFRNGVAVLTDDKPEADNIFEIYWSEEYLFRDLVVSLMDGTGWPFPFASAVTFSAAQDPFETNYEKFKAIFFCFDWDISLKPW